MKFIKLSFVLIVYMVCVMCFMTACEKHDGIDYFKSKCVAELNGQTYIDQTPFTISPDAIVTPELNYSDNAISFMTFLRSERNGTILYVVRINLFASEPDAFLSKEQIIEKIDFESTDVNSSEMWDYTRYCRDNRISYATVNSEIVDRGSFKITSYDKEKGQYHGTFTLNFSEGTLKGEFGR